MKKIVIFAILFLTGTVGFSKTWVVKSVGNTFSPATLTITLGDSVDFAIDPIHDVLEVSQATWNVNGSTALPGGFSTPFGGGLVLPDKLTAGDHYYVCTVHVSLGMKGMITVQRSSGIADIPTVKFKLSPNPSSSRVYLTPEENLDGTPFTMTDPSGRLVMTGILKANTTDIDISQLSPGVYLLQATGNRRLSAKVVRD